MYFRICSQYLLTHRRSARVERKRQWIAAHGSIPGQKRVNQWCGRLNMYHAGKKKSTAARSREFFEFSRALHSHLLREKIESNGIFSVPNLPRIASRKNLISCIVLSSSVLLARVILLEYLGIGNIHEQEIPLKICASDIQYHWCLINEPSVKIAFPSTVV